MQIHTLHLTIDINFLKFGSSDCPHQNGFFDLGTLLRWAINVYKLLYCFEVAFIRVFFFQSFHYNVYSSLLCAISIAPIYYSFLIVSSTPLLTNMLNSFFSTIALLWVFYILFWLQTDTSANEWNTVFPCLSLMLWIFTFFCFWISSHNLSAAAAFPSLNKLSISELLANTNE